jgi:hypothetical protein
MLDRAESRLAESPRLGYEAAVFLCYRLSVRRAVAEGNGPHPFDTVAAMIEDPERSARAVLAELEERLATHDLDRIVDF